MTKALHIAEGVELPIETVTEKLAWIGRTGQGKTYGAMKMAELMLDAAAQIIVLDFVGPWSGLRIPGTGKAYEIPVFGGVRGDVPLDPKSGALIADLIVDRGISAVLDVAQMKRSDQVRFCTDFAERFFDARKAKPAACHIFIEECQEAIPQNPDANEATMLGLFQRIWKIGRNYGIGGSLITQRPQEVSKKALNMSATMFLFQLVGAHERKAVKDWVQSADVPAKDIVDELPTLKRGEPRIWSVAFETPFTAVAKVLPKRTADVSATPIVGAASAVVQPMTAFDFSELAVAMASPVDEVSEDGAGGDVKALRARVAELESKLREASKPVVQRVEVSVLTADDRKLLNDYALRVESATVDLKGLVMTIRDAALKQAPAWPNSYRQAAIGVDLAAKPAKTLGPNSRADAAAGPGEVGEGALRKLLIALAQRPKGLTRQQIAVRANIGTGSSTWRNNVAKARGLAWITVTGNTFAITDAGKRALGAFKRLPTGKDLIDYWAAELGDAAIGKVFAELVEAYPDALTRDDIGKRAGVGTGSSTYRNNIARLKHLELIHARGDGFVASAELFA